MDVGISTKGGCKTWQHKPESRNVKMLALLELCDLRDNKRADTTSQTDPDLL